MTKLAIGALGHKIEDQLVILGADGTHGIMDVVHLVTGGEDILAVSDIFTEETLAVQWDGWRDFGGFENGGADIE